MDDLIRSYLSELGTALAVAPGPRRAHAEIVTEIGDGLADAVADHLDHGEPPRRAVRRAVEDFGPPAALAARFVPVLAAAQAHRYASGLLRTGPLVGALWLVAVFLGQADGPAVAVAAIAVAALLVVAVPCGVFAVVVTGRSARWSGVAPRRAVDAARTATSAAVLGDLVLLSTQAPAAFAGAPTDAAITGLAALASLTRLALATRGTGRLRRTSALLTRLDHR